MAANANRFASPYSEVVLDTEVTAATDTPMPLSFAGDSNTGLMRPAADTIAVVCGGAESVRFTSGALVQFAAAGTQANGTKSITMTSVAPASAGATIQGWIRAQKSDGTTIFIPHF